MGTKRRLPFTAVIGIGGIGQQARMAGIDGKLTWVGVGAHESNSGIITFDHFIRWDVAGTMLYRLAPRLASRFYNAYGPRSLFDSFNLEERSELDSILALAADAPPSLIGSEKQKIGRRFPKLCV